MTLPTPSLVITGVPRSPLQGTNTPVRLEIHDFVKNEKLWSLYVQALQELFDKDQTEPSSWFQIAGIHGLPYVSWDNSPGGTEGYCQHGNDIFPTWHRPYVALLEQVIQATVVRIADKYTVEKDAWKFAADNLRQPYWDWSQRLLLPDEIILQQEVSITKPEGRRTVPNPFSSYKFHPLSKSYGFPKNFDIYQNTLRYPTSSRDDAVTDIEKLKQALSSGTAQTQFTTNTQALFSISDWDGFSNSKSTGWGKTNSLESIHDDIHLLIGGRVTNGNEFLIGHMTDPTVAAFDPIFWLHHAQVDRIVSLWAGFNPNIWVPQSTLHTPLLPFWDSENSFWKSSTCTNTDTGFNYDYPDAKGHQVGAEKVQSIVTSSFEGLEPAINDALYHRWTARVHCNKYEVGSKSFSICFFLGPIPVDKNEWITSEHFIGQVSVFVNGSAEKCANCRNNVDVGIEGFVHIDDGIFKHANLPSSEPEVIRPYLKNNLRWDVFGDGTLDNLKSLEVVVLRTPLTLNKGAYFPSAGEPTYYHDVTVGLPGGSRQA